ncbi:MAG: hypothetical protein L3J03_09795 [Desulfobacterales bacterium]|nr:hypothetical protein [Desulfobacterales bacterium]
MNPTPAPPDDSFRIRCPRLGHQIHFSYCRRENLGIPCAKTLDCWYPYFPVQDFLQQELTPTEWRNAFAAPVKAKIVSLAELIEQARKRAKK